MEQKRTSAGIGITIPKKHLIARPGKLCRGFWSAAAPVTLIIVERNPNSKKKAVPFGAGI